jgi:hypothetical protein
MVQWIRGPRWKFVAGDNTMVHLKQLCVGIWLTFMASQGS